MASFPSTLSLPQPKRGVWIPALFAVLVVGCESQRVMGSDHTSVWLSNLLIWTGHRLTDTGVESLNHVLRKAGHFTGYGLFGLCFSRGWLSVLRKRMRTTWSGLRLRAGACGVATAGLLASCDEIHQSFLPNRTACVSDVLLDTCGAITVGLVTFAVLSFRRNRLIEPAGTPLTTLGLSLSGIPHQFAGRERVQRIRRSTGRRVRAVRSRMQISETV